MGVFSIDFFELSFLAENCIPPRPIARMCFWHRLIDDIYYELSQDQRDKLFVWINRTYGMEEGLKNKNEDCLLFNARFDKNNQYLVNTNYKGELKEVEAFLWQDEFHTSQRSFINAEFIITTKKIYNESE